MWAALISKRTQTITETRCSAAHPRLLSLTNATLARVKNSFNSRCSRCYFDVMSAVDVAAARSAICLGLSLSLSLSSSHTQANTNAHRHCVAHLHAAAQSLSLSQPQSASPALLPLLIADVMLLIIKQRLVGNFNFMLTINSHMALSLTKYFKAIMCRLYGFKFAAAF